MIKRRPPTGEALTWLFVVGAIPWIGALVYFYLGERRISPRRAGRVEARRVAFAKLMARAVERGFPDVGWEQKSVEALGMNKLGRFLGAFPTVTGSRGRLYTEAGEIFGRLVEDLDRARHCVLMEFYIWNEGGLADKVFEALMQAARRGVSCRVLVDAVGAAPWWRGKQPGRLREAGVELRKALPTGLFRSFVDRTDLRLHRKIVVIDGKVAWTGSMNMVDPKFFKLRTGVGEWVDALVRVEGLVVAPLAVTLIGDWVLESGESIEELMTEACLAEVAPRGSGDVQVVPSGPGTDDAVLQMLLATINSADEELTLTTPYFVPDESLLRALRGAAGRGVKVAIILPESVDSILIRYASRSYYDELIEMGVKIHLYRKGLLHTKSINADRRISMFGTVNLDMRSIWINYEVSLFVYGEEFGGALHELQSSYLRDSELLDVEKWKQRSALQQFLENSLRLLSPIL